MTMECFPCRDRPSNLTVSTLYPLITWETQDSDKMMSQCRANFQDVGAILAQCWAAGICTDHDGVGEALI